MKWLSAAFGHWVPLAQRCCGGESGCGEAVPCSGSCEALAAAAARAQGPAFCLGYCIQPPADFFKVGLAHRVGQL